MGIGAVVNAVDDEKTLIVRLEKVAVAEQTRIVREHVRRRRVPDFTNLPDITGIIVVDVTIRAKPGALRIAKTRRVPTTVRFHKKPERTAV